MFLLVKQITNVVELVEGYQIRSQGDAVIEKKVCPVIINTDQITRIYEQELGPYSLTKICMVPMYCEITLDYDLFTFFEMVSEDTLSETENT